MTRQLYVNLPVADLDRAVGFFTALGFEFNPKFTDESATCMVVNENAFVMLIVESRFEDFTAKETADAASQTEAILGFNADSRAAVDELVEKALAAGATKANEPYDHGFMYGRSFNDPDGHLWEVIWMDPRAAEQGPAEFAADTAS